MTSTEAIGRRVRLAREALGLSQTALGQLWGGRSHAAISDIERGKSHIPADELHDLARVLKTTPGALLDAGPTGGSFRRTTLSGEVQDDRATRRALAAFEKQADEAWKDEPSR
jgi:transcriptional regulator with XRE-family HTH domain